MVRKKISLFYLLLVILHCVLSTHAAVGTQPDKPATGSQSVAQAKQPQQVAGIGAFLSKAVDSIQIISYLLPPPAAALLTFAIEYVFFTFYYFRMSVYKVNICNSVCDYIQIGNTDQRENMYLRTITAVYTLYYLKRKEINLY